MGIEGLEVQKALSQNESRRRECFGKEVLAEARDAEASTSITGLSRKIVEISKVISDLFQTGRAVTESQIADALKNKLGELVTFTEMNQDQKEVIEGTVRRLIEKARTTWPH